MSVEPAAKRKRDAAEFTDTHHQARHSPHGSKRTKSSSLFDSRFEPAVDLHYGQRAALGVSEPLNSDDEEGTLAQQYLRSVRIEAGSIPPFLSARLCTTPSPDYDADADADDYDDDEEDDASIPPSPADTEGYYSDGAYLARPPLGPTIPPDLLPLSPRARAHDLLRTALLLRFLSLRRILARRPPDDAIARLGPLERELAFGRPAKQTYKTIVQGRGGGAGAGMARTVVAAMTAAGAARMLKAVVGRLLGRRVVPEARVGWWVWSLLARVREPGCVGCEEVGELREVAKRALGVKGRHWAVVREGVSFGSDEGAEDGEGGVGKTREGQVDAGSGSTEEDGHSATPERAADGEGGKMSDDIPTGDNSVLDGTTPLETEDGDDSTTDRPSSKLLEPSTLFTIEAIVLVVGELYGQRDLLEFAGDLSHEQVERLERFLHG